MCMKCLMHTVIYITYIWPFAFDARNSFDAKNSFNSVNYVATL